MSEKPWPLYEVFLRTRNGLSHKHIGSLHAVDDEMVSDEQQPGVVLRAETEDGGAKEGAVLEIETPLVFFGPAFDGR